MAQLKGIFENGLETIFKVFEEAVKSGTYGIYDDNEFSDEEPETCSIRFIPIQYKQKDIASLSFSDLIQPNDIIGIIPFSDVTIQMTSSGGYVTFADGTFFVVGQEKDPLDIMYTVLLRKN